MPKIKTKRAAAKRFKFTSKGKVMHKGAGMRHILFGKSSRRRRSMSREVVLSPTDERRVREMLPYGAS